MRVRLSRHAKSREDQRKMIELVQEDAFLAWRNFSSRQKFALGERFITRRAAVSEMGRTQHTIGSGRMETAGPQPKVGQEPRMPDHP
jgi:hypothetical protein